MALEGVGGGLSASLRAVDCVAGEMSQAAFGRLFGTDGALIPALTIILTLYVAFFAVSLLTGRSRIGIGALTPRMMTLGLVLTFATSWFAYQSVVWNMAVLAPDWIASVITGTQGSATQTFTDKIDVVFGMIQDVTTQQGQGQQPGDSEVTMFSPRGILWLGATLLLLGTVGVLVTCRIALAVLIALGPIFVVMAIFPATRGVFVGWLKGVVMLALGPLFAVLAGGVMLELSVPVLAALSPMPGEIEPRAAMAFFMIAAVHVALMILVLKVAGTMVSGWRVFGLADGAREASGSDSTRQPPVVAQTTQQTSGQSAKSEAGGSGQRRTAIAGVAMSPAANDQNGNAGGTRRETRFYQSGSGNGSSSANAALSRARGIGSRFRATSNAKLEKFK
jgi:type IV secretion system protein VirB6